MDEQRFKELMKRASECGGDYAAGYQRGLRRHYHGERFGAADEHEQWMAMDGHRQAQGDGYRAGFAGEEPRRGPGRPVTIGASRRNISLDDERAAFAAELGGGNVSEGIRRALDIAREVEAGK